ncbi:MAG: cell division protein FtsQ/DivIB [Pseudomonadota bacterium]
MATQRRKKIRADKTVPAGRRTKSAKRVRRPAQGATRKRPEQTAAPKPPSRWLNRLLILTAAVLVTVVATRAYLMLEQVPVQRISVTGELAHTQAETVQTMVQPALAGGFLNADLQLMRRELEALPWIYEVSVRRKWPSALEIHVVEQLPIARWGDSGFVNHEGEIFHSERGSAWQQLPSLQGPEGSAALLIARYQRLVELLAPLDLNVDRVEMDERGQIEVVLGGGIQLVVGREYFRQRMQRFAAVYRDELAQRREQLERVDLRYHSGLAVAYRESAQVAGL